MPHHFWPRRLTLRKESALKRPNTKSAPSSPPAPPKPPIYHHLHPDSSLEVTIKSRQVKGISENHCTQLRTARSPTSLLIQSFNLKNKRTETKERRTDFSISRAPAKPHHREGIVTAGARREVIKCAKGMTDGHRHEHSSHGGS